MQLYPIVLVAAILMHDRAARDGIEALVGQPPPTGGFALAWTFLPYAWMIMVAWIAVAWLRRRARKTGSLRAMLASYRVVSLVRLATIVHHVIGVFLLDSLGAVRSVIGDLPLIDEAIVLAGPIATLLATWFIIYPVERYIRDVTLIRRLDQGQTLFELPNRWSYVTLQLRTQVFPLFIPLVVILAVSELAGIAAASFEDEQVAAAVNQWGTLGATLLVFVMSPLIVRWVLSVEPMSPGALRMRMQDVCERNGVKVRELLLWKTGGAMINAAVMGLASPIRYVMMTDALIETMSERQLTAVMAHEVGHVRKHHMIWLLLSIFAILFFASFLVEIPLLLVDRWDNSWLRRHVWVEYLAAAVALIATILLFGWVSRRFERQADVFAVRHLSLHPTDHRRPDFIGPLEARHARAEPSQTVTAESVFTMQSALGTIARMNMVSPNRRSWRHGSIAWRQGYLGGIVGSDHGRLDIDRVVRRIRVAAIVMLVAGVGATAVIESNATESTVSPPSGIVSATPVRSLLATSQSSATRVTP